MNWLKKKPDPISDRARDLNHEIASLEAQIKKLDAKLHQDATQPRLRSTAVPRGETISHEHGAATTHPATVKPAHEPIFEDLEQRHLKSSPEPLTTPEHFNELGARKFDLTALLARMKQLFRGPTTMNPRLVSYLAAGGIQGLQPLRREKRIARNRFLLLTAVLFLVLFGLCWWFMRSH
ncbi:MAG: hypothetical protein EXS35_02250 [Pedosphaera sp.]|nr:hypothetical protein [Pedosphaera sp.]